MKFLILNGQNKQETKEGIRFKRSLKEIEFNLVNSGHEVKKIELRQLALKDCIGCYNCWLKTPGICIWKDDMSNLFSDLLKTDVVVIASPVKMSFISAHAKRFIDRQLPLIHPYLKMNGDRMGHLRRYTRQPRQLILLDDRENSHHVQAIYGQSAKGRQSIAYMSDGIEGVINELINN